jgi:hypothetical protein
LSDPAQLLQRCPGLRQRQLLLLLLAAHESSNVRKACALLQLHNEGVAFLRLRWGALLLLCRSNSNACLKLLLLLPACVLLLLQQLLL